MQQVAGDPKIRKYKAVNRLRQHLRKKKESLADHFEFKMYIAFHFKDKVIDLQIYIYNTMYMS